MLNNKGERELCYVVQIDAIEPIQGSDNCESAVVGGWHIMVRKGQFKVGNPAIYFEIDSKLPETEPFMFLAAKKFRIKTQKYTFGGKGNFISQGLLMHPEDFGWKIGLNGEAQYIIDENGKAILMDDFLTKRLGVTYYEPEDNARKAPSKDKYQLMYERRKKLFKRKFFAWLYKFKWGKKILFFFFGKKRDNQTGFPTKFPYIKKTDQERCENMSWVLQDKTPFIKTQKCDGSSGTYILERKGRKKFEFYVCSRNVRQLTPDQKSFYDENYYWQVAVKYDIQDKLKDFLIKNPDLSYVCWQGEICAPGIQGNPHKLAQTHFYCFHMIDSKKGKYDIREAAKIWKNYGMETVPIIDENYVLPDDFEQFKLEADGDYDVSVCEGKSNCKREGFVYYKTTDPNFSFKNVSREYLLKKS